MQKYPFSYLSRREGVFFSMLFIWELFHIIIKDTGYIICYSKIYVPSITNAVFCGGLLGELFDIKGGAISLQTELQLE